MLYIYVIVLTLPNLHHRHVPHPLSTTQIRCKEQACPPHSAGDQMQAACLWGECYPWAASPALENGLFIVYLLLAWPFAEPKACSFSLERAQKVWRSLFAIKQATQNLVASCSILALQSVHRPELLMARWYLKSRDVLTPFLLTKKSRCPVQSHGEEQRTAQNSWPP